MKKEIARHFFNSQNSLYVVLYNYLLFNEIYFLGKNAVGLSKKEVRRYIEQSGVVWNLSKIFLPTVKVSTNDVIQIEEYNIEFIAIENKTFSDNDKAIKDFISNRKPLQKVPELPDSSPTEINDTEQLNAFIEKYLQDKLGVKAISEIGQSDLKKAFAHVVNILELKSFNNVKASKYSYELIDFLKQELSNGPLQKELDLKKNEIAGSGKLIDLLKRYKTEKEGELFLIVESLCAGQYERSLFKFLQGYSKILNSQAFQYLTSPLLNYNLFSRVSIENLIKPIHEAYRKLEIDEKFQLFQENQERYTSYLNQIEASNVLEEKIFRRIGEYLFSLFKAECKTLESKPAVITIDSTSRKYNFKNTDREFYNIFLNIQNIGEGLGREIKLLPLDKFFCFDEYIVGILKPGENREVSIQCKLNGDLFTPVMNVKCIWLENSNIAKESLFYVAFELQNADIPWGELERKKPYTIQEIEDKEKLYGRDEILKELTQNILSDKIESYKLWGQKRVGKSSIVKTLKTSFNNQEKIIVIWRSIAGLKNTDPILTLNTLGESLCSEIFEELDRKITSSFDRERLRSVQVPEFNGSLFPLESYIKKLRRLDPVLRFVFILDEFDRINEEFFLPGNLGDSFSLNIGKGLSGMNYVGFILVGSENMHLLDRQEINYNSFQEREVDTFDKKREFDSFRQIIVGPVSPFISYTNEAIENIYDETNGNPYFANLICSNIFKICSKMKDNEVDIYTTQHAISIIVESSQKSHFEHFWGDGITEESNVKKERKADIRRRILVSYSLIYFQTKVFPEREQIIKNFKKPVEYNIEPYEIENTITEFFNRKIFFDDHLDRIRIKPGLFEQWLCGPGRTLMIEGVSDLEALQREKQLEVEHALKPEELQRVSETLIFKGDNIKVADFYNYFNQFGGPFEQRRIFYLMDSLFYISKSDVTDFIQKEKKNIFLKAELSLKDGAKTPYRENVEIYSFSRSLRENLDFIETFKRITLIRSGKTLKDIASNKDAWKHNNSDDIIIFESVIDEFADIQKELLSFFDEKLITDKIPVKLLVLLITSKAKADIIKATSTFANFKLIHFKEVEESKIKPFIDTTEVFKNSDEASYAFAEVRKPFHQTSKGSLNVLFEFNCPSKSIPILWHSTKQFKAIFPNSNGTIYTELIDDAEAYRDRVYHASKEFIQTINPFLINYLKNKAKNDGIEGEENWFRIPYLPVNCIKSITEKWSSENCQHPKETYFDLIHYKEVIRTNKELLPTFEIHDKKSGGNGLEWFDKINEIRRSPAHQEKPPPSLQEAEYFENKKDEIVKRLSSFSLSK